MNLALVLGQSSEKLKPKLISVKDNLNIECFTDLQQFINSSIKRELIHDRIIILSTLAKSDTCINDLYRYWDKHNRGSEIVYLCRKDKDDDLARTFLNRFCSTSVTSMSVTSTTLSILTEAVVFPISKLIELYGIPDYMAVEVEVDSYVEPEPEIETDEGTAVQPQNNTADTNKKPKEKRSLFGALFGKKKKSTAQEISPNVDNNTQSVDTEVPIEDNPIKEEAQELVSQQEEYTEEDTFNNDYYEQPVEDKSYQSEEQSDNLEDMYENHEETYDTSSSDNFDESEDEFYGTRSNTQEVTYDGDFADEETDDYDFTSTRGSQVEDDFGDLSYVDDSVNSSVSSQTPVADTQTQEVEDLSVDLTVGTAEEEYRKKTEQPKVIKETVVKEVIKSVKTSSVLENINKGIVHKSIIVTGDRGSGVTTTAWSLALHFAKKVPVLYFDCDVENHGLMNYIDYFDFKNYEETHMRGVKLCRNSQAFNSCVCKYNTNIDLLTSDFGVDVTDDELVLSQGIVAENLHKYGVVIVDCPISKLHCVQDLIMTASIALCVEESKRGYMNALMSLDKSELSLRYKRSMLGKGTMLRTKVKRGNDYKRIVSYINNIVDFEECNWLDMPTMEFTGKITTNLLTEILEG